MGRTIQASGGYQTTFKRDYGQSIPGSITTENSGGSPIIGARLWIRYGDGHDWVLVLEDSDFNGLEAPLTPPLIGLIPESNTNDAYTAVTVIPPPLLVNATGMRLELLSGGSTEINFGGSGGGGNGGGNPVPEVFNGKAALISYQLVAFNSVTEEFLTQWGHVTVRNFTVHCTTSESDGNKSLAQVAWIFDQNASTVVPDLVNSQDVKSDINFTVVSVPV